MSTAAEGAERGQVREWFISSTLCVPSWVGRGGGRSKPSERCTDHGGMRRLPVSMRKAEAVGSETEEFLVKMRLGGAGLGCAGKRRRIVDEVSEDVAIKNGTSCGPGVKTPCSLMQ